MSCAPLDDNDVERKVVGIIGPTNVATSTLNRKYDAKSDGRAFFLGARGRNATKSGVGRYFDNPSDSIAVQFLASRNVNFLERPKAIQARFGGVSGDDSDPSNEPGTAHASGTSIGAAIVSAPARHRGPSTSAARFIARDARFVTLIQ